MKTRKKPIAEYLLESPTNTDISFIEIVNLKGILEEYPNDRKLHRSVDTILQIYSAVEKEVCELGLSGRDFNEAYCLTNLSFLLGIKWANMLRHLKERKQEHPIWEKLRFEYQTNSDLKSDKQIINDVLDANQNLEKLPTFSQIQKKFSEKVKRPLFAKVTSPF